MTPRVPTVAVETNDGNGVKYRGVDKMEWGRYVARINFKNHRVKLGTYDTPEEAARAYDKRAVELRGAKAKTNFPLGPHHHNSNKGSSQSRSTTKSSSRSTTKSSSRSTTKSSLPDLNLGPESFSSRFPFPKIYVKFGMMVLDNRSESESVVMDTSTEGGRFDLNFPPPPEN